MGLEAQIYEILSLEKFANLDSRQKTVVKESIFANCLILSIENQKKYLDTIRNCVTEIEDLGDGYYNANGLCYHGIVITDVGRVPLDADGMIFPLNYKVKYREFSEPLGRLPRSVLHEFGHVVVKKSNINLLECKSGKDGKLLIDLGGLVINKSFSSDFGHALSEIINEFTNLSAFKAYFAYQDVDQKSLEKMQEFAKNNGLSIVNTTPAYLMVLPQDLFSSYTETYLANDVLPEGTKEMFNPLYVKYTPLVKLIINAFQNPCCTYGDLVNAFQNEEGLAAMKNGEPINDLFFGYYESSFHPLEVFDAVMKEVIDWEQFCVLFDKELYSSSVNYDFLDNSIEYFTEFYKKRNEKFFKSSKITQQELERNMDGFYKTVESCQQFYLQERENHK